MKRILIGILFVILLAQAGLAEYRMIAVDGSAVKYLDRVTRCDCAATARQIVLVEYTGGSGAVVSFHEKTNGVWEELFSCTGCVGRKGINKTKEGDGRTPTGTFNLTTPFGILADPGSAQPYTRVNKYLYWCGASGSPYYNRLVDSRKVTWNRSASDEHLIDYDDAYDYAMFIDYNAEGAPGRGSCIFLHCKSGSATAGCVAVPKADMKRIIQRAEAGTKIVIGKKQNLPPQPAIDCFDDEAFSRTEELSLTLCPGDCVLLRDGSCDRLPPVNDDIAGYDITADDSYVALNADEARCALEALRTGETDVYICNETVRYRLHIDIRELATASLPETLTWLSEEAFSNTACERIVLPTALKNCAASAFQGMNTLKQIIVPDTLPTAVMSALPGGGDILWLCRGSAAAAYAGEHGYAYIMLEG